MNQTQNLLAHLSLCWWNCNEISLACQKVASLGRISKEILQQSFTHSLLSGLFNPNKKLLTFQLRLYIGISCSWEDSLQLLYTVCKIDDKKGRRFKLCLTARYSLPSLRRLIKPGLQCEIPLSEAGWVLSWWVRGQPTTWQTQWVINVHSPSGWLHIFHH